MEEADMERQLDIWAEKIEGASFYDDLTGALLPKEAGRNGAKRGD